MMQVTAWNNGSHHASGAGYGLKLSAYDRDLQFDRGWNEVIVILPEGERVSVNIKKSSFWSENCRELISARIGRWFLSEGLAPWSKGKPPKLHLMQVNKNEFQLIKT